MLTRRLQVLLDEERWERLQARSSASGASIGAIVRSAIDEALPAAVPAAEEAAAQLLSAEPTPVGDWSDVKRELLDARGGAS